jgi:hypothetical protein
MFVKNFHTTVIITLQNKNRHCNKVQNLIFKDVKTTGNQSNKKLNLRLVITSRNRFVEHDSVSWCLTDFFYQSLIP